MRRFSSLLLCAGLFSAVCARAEEVSLRQVGTLFVDHPAFVNLEKFTESEPYSLVISSFGLFGGNAVRYIENIGAALPSINDAQAHELSRDVTWPNEAKAVPMSVFNKRMVLVAGGFLVPGQSNGALSLIDLDSGDVRAISTTKNGWFYHRAIWKDMNGDGKLDIVSARANKGMFGPGKGELVWLENPGSEDAAWKEHMLAAGPDVNFRFYDIDKDGREEIIATQFFTKKLSVFWFEGDKLNSRVVDDTLGSAFDLQVADLNRDGKDDLLVTNHEGSNGSIFAYEFPANFKTDAWTRHTLVTGIETRQKGMNQASPGSATAFQPKVGGTGKPFVVAGGDGSQRAHFLQPVSENPSDWTYASSEVTIGCTVGHVSVGDVNGDGYAEVFIPGYDKGLIQILTYAPAAR